MQLPAHLRHIRSCYNSDFWMWVTSRGLVVSQMEKSVEKWVLAETVYAVFYISFIAVPIVVSHIITLPKHDLIWRFSCSAMQSWQWYWTYGKGVFFNARIPLRKNLMGIVQEIFLQFQIVQMSNEREKRFSESYSLRNWINICQRNLSKQDGNRCYPKMFLLNYKSFKTGAERG